MSISLPEREAPPSKKARTAAYAGNRSDEDTSPSFFLDTFPKEVLDNILRFFSRVPQARDWVRSIPLQSIFELYGVTGELGKFMKPRFSTLYISVSFQAEYENCGMKWKEREGPMLWTDDLDVARRFVLAGGGQALRTIIVHPSIRHGEHETEIAEDFLNSCPNVKSSSIQDHSGLWVSRFGDQLEELEIETAQSSIIAKNCGNLRELSLLTQEIAIGEGVEKVGIEFWKSIGSKLECLRIRHSSLRGNVIQSIKTHCQFLRRICIYDIRNFTREYSDLLASYGDQLEYCHVEEMNESELTFIKSACKKRSIQRYSPRLWRIVSYSKSAQG